MDYSKNLYASEATTVEKEQIVRSMLAAIGENEDREGLRETPKRVVKAWSEWFAGYEQDPAAIIKAFADGAPQLNHDEMIIVSNIPVYSHCEHHIAPIIGVAHVGYIPTSKVLGLSKMPRLVECFARRLQVQERLTNQIADAMFKHLDCKGAGVLVRARHLCIESRGANKTGTITTTSALRGVFYEKPECRAEFLQLVRDAEQKQ